jgi:hypothetical protein
MDEDIIVTLKRSNDLLMTFGNDYSDVFLPAIDEIERLREENNDLKSALMNVLFSEVSHVEITEFTKEKE